MSVLPKGWAKAKIADVTIKCIQAKPSDNAEIKYIDIGSINRQSKKIEAPQSLIGKDAPSRARKIVNANDVLVSLTRPNLNAVALVDKSFDEQYASTGFEVLKPFGIDSRYLFALVRTNEFVNTISGAVKGALYPAAKSSDVQAYEFPLAPLNEQIRIAEKLDSILAKVDRVQARLDKIPSILKRFRQSILAAATSGELTREWRESRSKKIKQHFSSFAINEYDSKPLPNLPDGWIFIPFEHAATVKSNLVDPKLTPDAIHLAPNHIEQNTGKILEITTVTKDGVTSSKHRFFAGQIIYSKIRPYLNKVCLVDFDGVCSADMYPIEAKSNTKYLLYFMLSEMFVNWTSQQQGRVVLPKINQKALNKIPVAFPPEDEQIEIARRVDELLSHANTIEKHFIDARTRFDRIQQGILSKAFKGELVEQNDADEPADALLDRIKAQQNDSINPVKKVRKAAARVTIRSKVTAKGTALNQLQTKVWKLLQETESQLTPQQISHSFPQKTFEQIDALFAALKHLVNSGMVLKIGEGENCCFRANDK